MGVVFVRTQHAFGLCPAPLTGAAPCLQDSFSFLTRVFQVNSTSANWKGTIPLGLDLKLTMLLLISISSYRWALWFSRPRSGFCRSGARKKVGRVDKHRLWNWVKRSPGETSLETSTFEKHLFPSEKSRPPPQPSGFPKHASLRLAWFGLKQQLKAQSDQWIPLRTPFRLPLIPNPMLTLTEVRLYSCTGHPDLFWCKSCFPPLTAVLPGKSRWLNCPPDPIGRRG